MTCKIIPDRDLRLMYFYMHQYSHNKCNKTLRMRFARQNNISNCKQYNLVLNFKVGWEGFNFSNFQVGHSENLCIIGLSV